MILAAEGPPKHKATACSILRRLPWKWFVAVAVVAALTIVLYWVHRKLFSFSPHMLSFLELQELGDVYVRGKGIRTFQALQSAVRSSERKPPYGDVPGTNDNPFPGWLRGQKYGWTTMLPEGEIPVVFPLLWDWSRPSNQGNVPVLDWDGSAAFLPWEYMTAFVSSNAEIVHNPQADPDIEAWATRRGKVMRLYGH
jgi:hypothetical protein